MEKKIIFPNKIKNKYKNQEANLGNHYSSFSLDFEAITLIHACVSCKRQR